MNLGGLRPGTIKINEAARTKAAALDWSVKVAWAYRGVGMFEIVCLLHKEGALSDLEVFPSWEGLRRGAKTLHGAEMASHIEAEALRNQKDCADRFRRLGVI